jgi:enoyl-CoA hydratase
MATPIVSLEKHSEVTVIRLNRPPANAICIELAREVDLILESEDVSKARALVVTGTGPFFSGGLDLKAVPAYSSVEQDDLLDILNRLVGRLYAHPTPVVGAINGHAVAGAFILALATDYRVGPTGTAHFGLTEARVGIPFPVVPMIVLRAELSPQNVRYSALYARNFGPEEAQRRGLLDELQPPEAVLERAIEVATDMARMPADGYARIKRQVRQAAIAEIDEALANHAEPMQRNWMSPEAAEASAALLRKSQATR